MLWNANFSLSPPYSRHHTKNLFTDYKKNFLHFLCKPKSKWMTFDRKCGNLVTANPQCANSCATLQSSNRIKQCYATSMRSAFDQISTNQSAKKSRTIALLSTNSLSASTQFSSCFSLPEWLLSFWSKFWGSRGLVLGLAHPLNDKARTPPHLVYIYDIWCYNG